MSLRQDRPSGGRLCNSAFAVVILCAWLPVVLGDPPRLERVRGLRLPRRLAVQEWIPKPDKPCEPEHPLILIVVRAGDSRSEAAGHVKMARRLARDGEVCVAIVSPDSPGRVRRWLAGRPLDLPIGAGARWARRFDRHRGIDLYLWIPEQRALYALRSVQVRTPTTSPASDVGEDLLVEALADQAALDALEFRFETLRLLGRFMPFERYQQLVDRIARGRPPASASQDAISRGLWWQRLRWTLAQADPALDATTLTQYAKRPLAPVLGPEVGEPALATAESLPIDALIGHYSSATAQDDPVTLSIRSVVIRSLEQRSPQEVEAFVRTVAFRESNPWLRNRLLNRYLYDVRPRTREQLEFLRRWREQLPYYDLAAARIDSYLDAIERGQDPFQPVEPTSEKAGAP